MGRRSRISVVIRTAEAINAAAIENRSCLPSVEHWHACGQCTRCTIAEEPVGLDLAVEPRSKTRRLSDFQTTAKLRVSALILPEFSIQRIARNTQQRCGFGAVPVGHPQSLLDGQPLHLLDGYGMIHRRRRRDLRRAQQRLKIFFRDHLRGVRR